MTAIEVTAKFDFHEYEFTSPVRLQEGDFVEYAVGKFGVVNKADPLYIQIGGVYGSKTIIYQDVYLKEENEYPRID